MSHPDDGIYRKDGIGYIAVSNVLGRTLPLFNPSKVSSLEWWQNNEPDAVEILERGQQRGTFIHAEVELALTGANRVHVKDRPSYEEMMSYNIHGYMTYLQPLLLEMKKQNPCSSLCSADELAVGGDCMETGSQQCSNLDNMLLIEKPIFCPYGWAGTPDVRLWWDSHYTIWDWKSVRSHKEEGVQKKEKSMRYYAEAFVQIGAYALAHNILAKQNPFMTPITQGVICICYDWREPHVHVLNRAELKKAANAFVQRYKVFQDLAESKFPIKL
jgi:hypothetical protein